MTDSNKCNLCNKFLSEDKAPGGRCDECNAAWWDSLNFEDELRASLTQDLKDEIKEFDMWTPVAQTNLKKLFKSAYSK